MGSDRLLFLLWFGALGLGLVLTLSGLVHLVELWRTLRITKLERTEWSAYKARGLALLAIEALDRARVSFAEEAKTPECRSKPPWDPEAREHGELLGWLAAASDELGPLYEALQQPHINPDTAYAAFARIQAAARAIRYAQEAIWPHAHQVSLERFRERYGEPGPEHNLRMHRPRSESHLGAADHKLEELAAVLLPYLDRSVVG